jgi:uncharacterized protein (DUF3084 family)
MWHWLAVLVSLPKTLETIMSELTQVAIDLKAAREQIATVQTGVTQIGKDTAKLLQQALDAETPEEKAAVAAEFELLKADLAKLGGDVSTIDALVPDEPAP